MSQLIYASTFLWVHINCRNTVGLPYSHVWDDTGSHILSFCKTGDITHKVGSRFTLPAMNEYDITRS